MATTVPTPAIQAAGKMLGPSLTLSAGDGRARLVVDSNRLEVSAHGHESTLTVTLPVEGVATAEAVVRGSMLLGFLTTAAGGTVELQFGEELNLKSGHGEMNLPCAPNDSWHALEHVEAKTTTWDSSTLAQLKRITHAASTKESQPVLQGVCFADGRAVATDGNQLAAVDVDLGFAEELIVPAVALDAVERLHDGFATVEVCASERHLTFRTEQWRYTTTLIVGTFPDWQAAVPEPDEPALRAYQDQLLAALKSVRIVAEKDLLNKVNIERLDDEWLRAWAHLPDVGHHEEIFQGTMRLDRIAFNLDRLIPAIEHLNRETVAVEMADVMKPAVLRAEGYLASVMPIRS